MVGIDFIYWTGVSIVDFEEVNFSWVIITETQVNYQINKEPQTSWTETPCPSTCNYNKNQIFKKLCEVR